MKETNAYLKKSFPWKVFFPVSLRRCFWAAKLQVLPWNNCCNHMQIVMTDTCFWVCGTPEAITEDLVVFVEYLWAQSPALPPAEFSHSFCLPQFPHLFYFWEISSDLYFHTPTLNFNILLNKNILFYSNLEIFLH